MLSSLRFVGTFVCNVVSVLFMVAGSAFLVHLSYNVPNALLIVVISLLTAGLLGRFFLVTHPFWRKPAWVELEAEILYYMTALLSLFASAVCMLASAWIHRLFVNQFTWVFLLSTALMLLGFAALAFSFFVFMTRYTREDRSEKKSLVV